MTDKAKDLRTDANPWSDSVVVLQVPESGLHRDIEADAAERDALAKLADLRDVLSAKASFDLTHMRDGGMHVLGRVSARVGQTCVVTLDPIENEMVEEIDLVFVPEAQVRALAGPVDDEGEDDGDITDSPEPIVNGIIDLGRLATDALILGLDPYPRKSGVVFEPPAIAADPEDHPFAALRALKSDPTSPDRKKPRGR